MKTIIKKKFNKLRKNLKLTPKQISEYLGVDENHILKIEKGEIALSFKIAEKMCNLIGNDISYFYNDNKEEIINPNFCLNELEANDLRAIALINKIAIKLREMEYLLLRSS